jgi:hypothetical protein
MTKSEQKERQTTVDEIRFIDKLGSFTANNCGRPELLRRYAKVMHYRRWDENIDVARVYKHVDKVMEGL